MSTMKNKTPQDRWQQRNPDKARVYTAKYQSGKKKISVILGKELAEQIDRIKPPSQTYGGWVREQIEKLVKTQLS